MIGASPSVGSSMTRRRGLPSSARPIASICCSPPDNCEPPLVSPLVEPRKGLVDALDRPLRIRAAGGDQAQMLVDRQARPDAPPLRDVADAVPVNDVRLEAGGLAAEDADAARARGLEAGDGVAERALAHPVAADHGENAGADRHGHALYGVALAVIDVEVADLECGMAAGLSHGRLRDRPSAPRGRLRSPAACPP